VFPPFNRLSTSASILDVEDGDVSPDTGSIHGANRRHCSLGHPYARPVRQCNCVAAYVNGGADCTTTSVTSTTLTCDTWLWGSQIRVRV
jgi:hypothetical protein